MLLGPPSSLLPLLLVLLLSTPTASRQGPTNSAQHQDDQLETHRSADHSPTGIATALPCPRGTFRPSGIDDAECELCPLGRYGSIEGLTKSTCTADCPVGRYNDERGAMTEDDCLFCPPGKFGASVGQKTRECSGSCPAGKYSSEFGITNEAQCVTCPTGYRGWQCSWELSPRRGHFVSTDGKINEASHAYLDVSVPPPPLPPTLPTNR